MRNNFTLLICLIFLGFASSVNAQVVTSEADDGSDGTLRVEIADTPDGGVVTFDGIVSSITLTMGEITIDKNITITGYAPDDQVEIDGNGTDRIFSIFSGAGSIDVVLNNLFLTNGSADNGGAIEMQECNVTINGCSIRNNAAEGETTSSGGGIFNNLGLLTVNDSDFRANTAVRAGGAIEVEAGAGLALVMDTVDMVQNRAESNPGNGGALHITGPADSNLTGVRLQANTAAAEGGGFWNGAGTMTIDNCLILGNFANGNDADQGGGGIYNEAGTLIIRNGSRISTNNALGTSGSGGGILNNSGTLSITDSFVQSNDASRAGGGIEEKSVAGQMLTMTNVDLSDNSVDETSANPGNGGGLHITGPGNSTITGGQVRNNIAASEGGGLWNGTGIMTISAVEISANVASGDAADEGGGGIYNNGGTLTVLAGTTIFNNTADGTSGSGGGVFSTTGRIEFDRVVISDNTANRAGGAIEMINGQLLLLNTDMLGNNAGVSPDATASPGNGGGLHISGSASSQIFGGDFLNNVAANEGGALWNGSGSMSIQDALISSNTASGDDSDTGGGGIYNEGGTISISNDTTISNNVANGTSGSGGGILNNSGTLTIANSVLSGNSANRAGGGIETVGGILNLTNLNLDDNDVDGGAGTPNPGNGGGLHVSGAGTVNITGGTVNNNDAAAEGGGLWNGSDTMTLDAVTVDSNTASGADANQGGGGLYNLSGILNITNGSAVTNNTADGASGSGGGILNDTGATLNVSDSDVSGNSASRAGGGIEDNSGAGLGVVLSNVTLNGNSTASAPGNGGGLHVTGPGDVNVTGGTVNNNTASAEGGGLWNGGGTMNVDGVTIDNNTASGADANQGGGGLYNLSGTLNITNGSAITNNIADGASGSGGGILNDTGATLNVSDSDVSGNSASRAGGGIEDNSGAGLGVVLSNVTLNGNSTASAPGNGGGLHVTGPGDVNVTGGTVNNNTASAEGGGLWNGGGTMNVDGVTIDNNTASGADANQGGGGLYNLSGILNITNGSAVTNNTADGASGSGGGILNDTGATLNVSDSDVSGNSASRAGGGIEDNSGAGLGILLINITLNGNSTGSAPGNGGGLHITGAGDSNITLGTVNNNTASAEGGGLWNGSGVMNIDQVTIDGNTASGDDADNGGGGVYNNGGTVNIDQSTISNNDTDGASGSGGGINNGAGGTLSLFRSTVSGNTSSGAGGGVVSAGLTATVEASTIALNTAGDNGGGIAGETSVIIENTIVAYNNGSAGNDVSGLIVSNGYNLVMDDDASAFTALATDIEGEDPLAGPLQDNGGPTFTHELLDGSPAFDAGNPADAYDDQRGFAVFNGTRDIGSFEAQANLSIADFAATGIQSIYPNPTTGRFFVEVSNTASNNLKLQIVSIAGQLMSEYNMFVGKNEINADQLSTGIYILNISDGNTKISHKLIVQ